MGTNFTKFRISRKLTQKDIADYIGITDQTVSNWERGISIPTLTLRQVLKLCQYLDTTIEVLADLLEPRDD